MFTEYINKRTFVLSLQVFIIILVSYFLFSKLITGSGCEASGCKAAASLINIPQIYLEITGLLFSLSLLLFYLFYKSFYKYILLFGALFELIIFSFQVKNNIFCPFCFSFMFPLMILFLIEFKEKALISLLSIPVALFILNLNSSQVNISNVVYSEGPYTLISSNECPHCKKVKKYLFDHMIDYKNIDISTNPNIVLFLKRFEFKGIPVLIEKKNDNEFEIIYGQEKIIRYLDKKDKNIEAPAYYDLQPMNENGGCMLVNPSCNK